MVGFLAFLVGLGISLAVACCVLLISLIIWLIAQK
jgi:hypothetical protein